jgi:hypothetical protein
MSDTYCLTCGRKNCPKLSYCPRKDLERDERPQVKTSARRHDEEARRRYYAR